MLFELLRAGAAVQAHLDARLAQAGLSVPRLAALSVLRAGDPLPLSQVAERLACVKSNITQLVDRLEADGLVRRIADPNDRRSRLAELTAAGRTACDAGMRLREQAEQELLARLEDEDVRTLAVLMDKLTNRNPS